VEGFTHLMAITLLHDYDCDEIMFFDVCGRCVIFQFIENFIFLISIIFFIRCVSFLEVVLVELVQQVSESWGYH
jgi:hypothetical protein